MELGSTIAGWITCSALAWLLAPQGAEYRVMDLRGAGPRELGMPLARYFEHVRDPVHHGLLLWIHGEFGDPRPFLARVREEPDATSAGLYLHWADGRAVRSVLEAFWCSDAPFDALRIDSLTAGDLCPPGGGPSRQRQDVFAGIRPSRVRPVASITVVDAPMPYHDLLSIARGWTDGPAEVRHMRLSHDAVAVPNGGSVALPRVGTLELGGLHGWRFTDFARALPSAAGSGPVRDMLVLDGGFEPVDECFELDTAALARLARASGAPHVRVVQASLVDPPSSDSDTTPCRIPRLDLARCSANAGDPRRRGPPIDVGSLRVEVAHGDARGLGALADTIASARELRLEGAVDAFRTGDLAPLLHRLAPDRFVFDGSSREASLRAADVCAWGGEVRRLELSRLELLTASGLLDLVTKLAQRQGAPWSVRVARLPALRPGSAAHARLVAHLAALRRTAPRVAPCTLSDEAGFALRLWP